MLRMDRSSQSVTHDDIIKAVAAQGEAIAHLTRAIETQQGCLNRAINRLTAAEIRIGQGQILMVALSVASPVVVSVVLALSIPLVSSLYGVHVKASITERVDQ